MKKLVAIGVVMAVALAMVLSFTLPAAATPIGTGTGVVVTEGDSAAPIIKAKWEVLLEAGADLEDGDPTHIIGPNPPLGCPPCGVYSPCRAQFLPSGLYDVNKTVQYYVMVKDSDGPGDIANVYVSVFHPNWGPDCPPVDGGEKYELRLTEIDKGLIYDGQGNVIGYDPAGGVAAFQAALAADLVEFSTVVDPSTGLPVVADPIAGPTPEEMEHIMWELDKCDARIYKVEGPLHYHQPCGKYTVKAKAVDVGGSWAQPLYNCFEYLCMQAFRVDFTSVAFGNVNLCTTKWVYGDTEFLPGGTATAGDPAAGADTPATVHNVGNMPMRLAVAFGDMDLDITGLAPTTISTDIEQFIIDNTTWNVYFDARLGGNPIDERFMDPFDQSAPANADLTDLDPALFTTLPTVLLPCTPQQLELSIHIIKADPTIHSGVMVLECVEADWPCPGGDQVPGADPYPPVPLP
jgi:hypothetical protein